MCEDSGAAFSRVTNKMKQGTCVRRVDHSQQPPERAVTHAGSLPGEQLFARVNLDREGQQGGRCENKDTPGTVGIASRPE